MSASLLLASDDNTPSLAEQAGIGGFKAGIIDFQHAQRKDGAYFNSGMVVRPDGRWLICRRSFYDPSVRVGRNDIVRFQMDGLRPIKGWKVDMRQQFTDEHFEDPRAIHHNGYTWISACNFTWGRNARRWSGAHQVMCRFDMDWRCTGRYDVPYGGNGYDVGRNTVHQKNWCWFVKDGRMHLLYRASPHTVVEFTDKFVIHDYAIQKEHITDCDDGWEYGEIRGGTPPVLVEGKYWTFFHSSLPETLNRRKTRRYYMGAYVFEALPPFNITRMTKEPLLAGTYQDRWGPDKPACTFACGSVIDDQTWTIVGGSNDLNTFWCRLPHLLLKQRLSPVIPLPWPHHSEPPETPPPPA